jgi:hypothetical protein
MKEGWMGIKGCHIIDDMRANNVLTNMVVSNSTLSLKAMGQLIGVNPRILSIVMTFLVRECYGSPKKHEFERIL